MPRQCCFMWRLLYVSCTIASLHGSQTIVTGAATTTTATTHRLNGAGVQRGNGVVRSRDGTLWITAADGTLTIMGDATEASFQPLLLSNRVTECRSSVILYEEDDVVQYGVYTVVDMPHNEEGAIVSRVIAVTPSGKAAWETIVAGVAEGTPQMRNGVVFVTHNDIDARSGGYSFGKVTLIQRFGLKSEIALNGAGLFGGPLDRQAPFGPLSTPVNNRMYFGESWGRGESRFGVMYGFNGTHVEGLLRTDWSTVTPPTVSSDGKSMWAGGTASSVHGWVGRSFTKQPTWSVSLGSGESPIASKLLVTSDKEFLFVLTPQRRIFCLEASTGDKVWSNDGQEVQPSTMQLSGDESTLFTIGGGDGVIARFDAHTGRHLATISCFDIWDVRDCAMTVEGEFAVSYDGADLFFGEANGEVVSLNVGLSDDPLSPTGTPTDSPSRLPTEDVSMSPSLSFSTSPSNSPTELHSLSPTQAPTVEPSVTFSTSPTALHSFNPSKAPTLEPSIALSTSPTNLHSFLPSESPTVKPSVTFSSEPTELDSSNPSAAPIHSPALAPSATFAPVLPAPITSAPITSAPITSAPITSAPVRKSTTSSVLSSPTAFQPSYTIAPAFSPAMSPAEYWNLTSAEMQGASPVLAPAAADLPRNGSKSLEPTKVSGGPSSKVINFDAYVVDLDTLKESPKQGTKAVGRYLESIGIVLTIVLVVMLVGVVTGRLWQFYRDQWRSVPRQDKFGDKFNGVRNNARFDLWQHNEDVDLEKRLREMN